MQGKLKVSVNIGRTDWLLFPRQVSTPSFTRSALNAVDLHTSFKLRNAHESQEPQVCKKIPVVLHCCKIARYRIRICWHVCPWSHHLKTD